MTACFDMAPDAEKTEQVWKIGKDNGVGNVVVWIQPPEGYYFTSDPAKPTWPDKVELTQPHCVFIPHVNWVMPTVLTEADGPKKPVPSGQKFPMSNTAAVSHNTKWEGGSTTAACRRWSRTSRRTRWTWLNGQQRVQVVHFTCNIHPWMDAYVLVFNHPYAAITDDDGNLRDRRTCRPVPRCTSRPGTRRGRTKLT